MPLRQRPCRQIRYGWSLLVGDTAGEHRLREDEVMAQRAHWRTQLVGLPTEWRATLDRVAAPCWVSPRSLILEVDGVGRDVSTPCGLEARYRRHEFDLRPAARPANRSTPRAMRAAG